jgi:hypothetical protein
VRVCFLTGHHLWLDYLFIAAGQCCQRRDFADSWEIITQHFSCLPHRGLSWLLEVFLFLLRLSTGVTDLVLGRHVREKGNDTWGIKKLIETIRSLSYPGWITAERQTTHRV